MVSTTNFEKAMKAALEGPEVKKIKIEKHEFNVKPVKSTGDRVTGPMYKGQISHHLAWRDDDQVYYEFQVHAAQRVTIEQVKVQVDESWMQKIVVDLIESLGEALKEWLTEKGKEKLDASTKALATNSEDAQRRIFEESKHLLDGSWLGEAKFMIVNIAGRLAIRQAQVVYRQTKPPTKPRGGVVVRDHRTTPRTSTP
jgi:hypothetical protein